METTNVINKSNGVIRTVKNAAFYTAEKSALGVSLTLTASAECLRKLANACDGGALMSANKAVSLRATRRDISAEKAQMEITAQMEVINSRCESVSASIAAAKSKISSMVSKKDATVETLRA